jgi:5-methyltetrahydrofolate--homocysteine methyltransferase
MTEQLSEQAEELLDAIYDFTLNGEAEPVVELTQQALDMGIDPLTILFDALIPSLEEVGRLFEGGTYFVPEMLVAAKAMQGAMDILKPLIAETGAKPVGTFVMGTVKGDIHDIGKDLCNIMLEGAGFKVFDLGVNVPPDVFVEAVQEHRPDFLGMSAFLTTTITMFKPTMEALAAAGLRDQVKIFVGGAPVTQVYADGVGADGYAPNASALVRECKAMLAMA